MPTTLKCRPSEADAQCALVYLSAIQMLNLKVSNGELLDISTTSAVSIPAVAWTTSRADIKDTVIGVSKWMQQKCGINLGSDVNVSKSSHTLTAVSKIALRSIDDSIAADSGSHWGFAAKVAVQDQTFKYLAVGQKLTISIGKQRKEVEVQESGGSAIFKIGEETDFQFGASPPAIKITFDDIVGNERQKAIVRRLLNNLTDPDFEHKFPGRTRKRGIILYGSHGTGKTLLRQAIEGEKEWSTVTAWRPGTKVSKSSSPRLMHCKSNTRMSEANCDSLSQLFAETEDSPTLIVCEAATPNDVSQDLRSARCFALEVEMPVPDATQRYQMLQKLFVGTAEHDLLQSAAERTHGYVGGDLLKLQDAIYDAVEERSSGVEQEPLQPTIVDLEMALRMVKPSALQEIFLEKPNVRWTDIGGQLDFKERLQNAVDWPLKFSESLAMLGVRPKKGILLYGPPGCSKTMLVKALATESDLNFLAVKGAELVSMYVGESERATREVFRKARAASPCIIFFDEIDAIAKRSTSGSDLNVLTTLLNEMDGFEELRNVLVVAATNKPESIDPALMRPGRFDNVLYVGPPDANTRKEILRTKLSKVNKDFELSDDLLDKFSWSTDGLSGAEIVFACESAGEIAFKDNRRTTLSTYDVSTAIQNTPRSITANMLQEFDNWNAARAQA